MLLSGLLSPSIFVNTPSRSRSWTPFRFQGLKAIWHLADLEAKNKTSVWLQKSNTSASSSAERFMLNDLNPSEKERKKKGKKIKKRKIIWKWLFKISKTFWFGNSHGDTDQCSSHNVAEGKPLTLPTGGDSDPFSLICKQYLICKNELQRSLILYWIPSITVWNMSMSPGRVFSHQCTVSFFVSLA